MKKLILSFLLIASITTAYAQKSNVNRANNLARSATPDFAAARTLIAPALQHETTRNVANTWFVAGRIGYEEIRNYEILRDFSPGALSPSRQGEIALESFNYFLVADSLDQLPDDKGRVRPRHRRDIKRMITHFYIFNFTQYGGHLWEENNYAGAFDAFNVFLSVPDLPLMEGSVEKDTTYYMIMYFAALAASNSDQPQEAIRLLEQLTNKDVEQTLAAFDQLYKVYQGLNDTTNYVRVLKEAMKRFPAETYFLNQLIIHYISIDQPETALAYLETAIQSDPTFAQYHFIEGSLHEQLGNMDKAEAAYRRAIELDPELAGAQEALGRFHLNRGQAIDNASFSIRDNNLRRQEDEKAANEFRLALPFFQKAVALEPEVTRHKMILRNLYYRLNMDSEYDALTREMGINE